MLLHTHLGLILLFVFSSFRVVGYFMTLNLMFYISFLELVNPSRESYRDTGFLK